jgi:hypothetical protein
MKHPTGCGPQIPAPRVRLRYPLVFLALALAISGASAKKPYMAPQPVASFHGKTWAAITLGVTTQHDIKDQVRTDTSNYHDALQMAQPKNAGIHVEVLCSGKDRPVSLILLRYDGNGPDEKSLVSTMPAERLIRPYETGRLEDWWMDIWPDRGIVAFVTGGTASIIALALPAHATTLAHQMSVAVTPVVQRVDPHAGEPKVSTFGSTDVTFSVQGIRIDESAERLSWERQMRRATAGGALRYVEGAAGSYSATVSGKYDPRNGGMITVSCSINGNGPYGPVSGSGSEYAQLYKNPYGDRVHNLTSSVNYSVAFSKAMSEAEADFETRMQNQGPPPIESVRLADWQRMIEDLRTVPQSAG